MKISEKLKWMVDKIPDWLKEDDFKNRDVVLSTRVRLARNIKGHPFPPFAGEDDNLRVYYRVTDALKSIKQLGGINIYPLWELDRIEREFLLERHLASPDLISNDRGRGLAIDFSEKIGIMINEEDHLRIQCIYPGFHIEDAFLKIMEIDDLIGSLLVYSFKAPWGYLTCCPTNVGTGFRISTLLHLPALVYNHRIENILRESVRHSLIARGYYGEGTEVRGNIFQFSTSSTLGHSEDALIQKFKEQIVAIIEEEKMARQELLKNAQNLIEDRIYRAFGILKNARILSSTEVMELTSHLRMGIGLDIIHSFPISRLNELLLYNQPAHLQMRFGRTMDQKERDYLRGLLVRKMLESEGSGI